MFGTGRFGTYVWGRGEGGTPYVAARGMVRAGAADRGMTAATIVREGAIVPAAENDVLPTQVSTGTFAGSAVIHETASPELLLSAPVAIVSSSFEDAMIIVLKTAVVDDVDEGQTAAAFGALSVASSTVAGISTATVISSSVFPALTSVHPASVAILPASFILPSIGAIISTSTQDTQLSLVLPAQADSGVRTEQVGRSSLLWNTRAEQAVASILLSLPSFALTGTADARSISTSLTIIGVVLPAASSPVSCAKGSTVFALVVMSTSQEYANLSMAGATILVWSGAGTTHAAGDVPAETATLYAPRVRAVTGTLSIDRRIAVYTASVASTGAEVGQAVSSIALAGVAGSAAIVDSVGRESIVLVSSGVTDGSLAEEGRQQLLRSGSTSARSTAIELPTPDILVPRQGTVQGSAFDRVEQTISALRSVNVSCGTFDTSRETRILPSQAHSQGSSDATSVPQLLVSSPFVGTAVAITREPFVATVHTVATMVGTAIVISSTGILVPQHITVACVAEHVPVVSVAMNGFSAISPVSMTADIATLIAEIYIPSIEGTAVKYRFRRNEQLPEQPSTALDIHHRSEEAPQSTTTQIHIRRRKS